MPRIATVAIVGCGRVTETLHLPVAANSERFRVTWLVDADVARARRLADLYDVPSVAGDYRAVLGQADAAIVALPNHMHAAVTIDLLRRGSHVLVEKPMALTVADCDAMIAAAREMHRVLAVGLVRRFFAASRFVKKALDQDLLGEIRQVDVREGGVFGWKAASDAMFRRESGGGLLTDIGVHALDLLLWWFDGIHDLRYRDDAEGGVEAECELRFHIRNGGTGVVELSRLRRMRNSVIIVGDRGTLEVGTRALAEARLRLRGAGEAMGGQIIRDGRPDRVLIDVFQRQLEDFAMALESGGRPLVPGIEGRCAIELIEHCRRIRASLRRPWSSASPGGGQELVT